MMERLRRVVSAALRLALRTRYLRPSGPALERLGSRYGGWWVPAGLVRKDWVVYSAGVGEDVSFDEALIGQAGCEVHAFDPTPRALAYVESRSGLPPGFHLHTWGLWGRDATVRFWAPRDPAHVSHSIGNLQGTAEGFEAEVRTIDASMRALGHHRLDLLKLDVEGAEVEVLDQMLPSGLRPAVLCVELDRPSFIMNLWLVERLRRAGYVLVRLEERNLTLLHPEQLAARARAGAG